MPRAWIGGIALTLTLALVATALSVVGSAESERYLDSILSGDADWYVVREQQSLGRQLIAVFRFTRVSIFALYCAIAGIAAYAVSRWVLRAALDGQRSAAVFVCIGLPIALMFAAVGQFSITALAAAPLSVGAGVAFGRRWTRG